MLTFKGGIKPDSHKYTKNIPICETLPPRTLKIPTYNDLICVSVGDNVLIGQKLTLNNRSHSPICGVVESIDNNFVTIKNNDGATISGDCVPFSKRLCDSDFDDIYNFIRKKGICFNNGFLDDRLKKSKDKVSIIIVSCGETTPFSCSRYRIFTELKKEIIYGTRIIMKALNVSKSAITMENTDFRNRLELQKLLKKNNNITLLTHSSKYPADNHAVLKKQFINKFFKNSKNVTEDNILVIDCEEAVAVFKAFKTGIPMINRVVTVDGDTVQTPKNILAPIGISFKELFSMCETEIENISEIVINNPISYNETDVKSIFSKETGCILALENKPSIEKGYDCILCHRCYDVCPVGLNPKQLLEQRISEQTCLSCGACTYICPAKIDFFPIYCITEDYENNE